MVKNKIQLHLIPVISIIVVLISLFFSIRFFATINLFFAVLVVIIEITKAIYINYIGKGQTKSINILMVVVICFAVLFSVTGVVSNGYNFILENDAKQFKTIDNPKYSAYLKDLSTKENTLATYKKELDRYPSLDEYKKGSPSWEDKTQLVNNYQKGRTDINSNIDKSVKDLNSLNVPEKTIQIQSEFTGYNLFFKQISNMTGIKVNTLLMILTFMFAVLIELIIFSLFLMNKNVVKTCDKVEQKNEPITTFEPIATSEIITPVAKITTCDNEIATCDNEIATVVIECDKKIEKITTLAKPVAEGIRDKKIISITTKKDSQLKEITTYITTKYKAGDVVNSKDIRLRYNLTDRQWSNVKIDLGDKVITQGTKTYYLKVPEKSIKKK